jgi:hypothetical protein
MGNLDSVLAERAVAKQSDLLTFGWNARKRSQRASLGRGSANIVKEIRARPVPACQVGRHAGQP